MPPANPDLEQRGHRYLQALKRFLCHFGE